MANKPKTKITEADLLTPVVATDRVPIGRPGTDTANAATLEALKTYILTGASGTGNVIGPESSTNNHIALFDGATGALLKDSGELLSSFLTSADVGVTFPATTHSHDGTGAEGPKLTQANTHESADTDTATTSLHHTLGTGANQSAPGNHTHSQLHDAVTVADTNTVNLTLTGQQISADVNTGLTATTVAAGNKVPTVYIRESTIPIQASNIMYDASGNVYAATKDALYKSTDGGYYYGTAALKSFTGGYKCFLLEETRSGAVFASFTGGAEGHISAADTGVFRSTDGGSTWTEVLGNTSVTYSSGTCKSAAGSAPADWAALTAYSVGDVRKPVTNNNYVYYCSSAGTSGATEPAWPMNHGATVVDGGVTWSIAGVFDWEPGICGYTLAEHPDTDGTLLLTGYILNTSYANQLLYKSTDDGVTWQDITPRINPLRNHSHDAAYDPDTNDIYYVPGEISQFGASAQWAATTAYALHARVRNAAGTKRYRCIKAGTSGSSEPSGTSYTTAYTDGTAVWEYIGAYQYADGDPIVLKSTDGGANFTADRVYASAMGVMPNFQADTCILCLGSGVCITATENRGESQIWRRNGAGTWSKVWTHELPVDTTGPYSGDAPIGTDPDSRYYAMPLKFRKNATTGNIYGFLKWHKSYVLSTDSGATWFEAHELGVGYSPGGCENTSKFYNNSVLACMRLDDTTVYWSSNAIYSHALMVTESLTAPLAVISSPVSLEGVPNGAGHTHINGAGAAITESAFSFSDVTTANASTGAHGLLPKLGGGTSNFLRADGSWAAPPTGGGSTESDMGIGTLSPSYRLHVVKEWGSPASTNITRAVASYGDVCREIGLRANGTISSPSSVSINNTVYAIGARGYGATGFPTSSQASITFIALENFTDSAMGMCGVHYATPTGSTTAAEVFRVTHRSSTPEILLAATAQITIPLNAGAGKNLYSDANGTASWGHCPHAYTSGGTLTASASDYVLVQSSNNSIVLPDPSAALLGKRYIAVNNYSGSINLSASSGGSVMVAGGILTGSATTSISVATGSNLYVVCITPDGSNYFWKTK